MRVSIVGTGYVGIVTGVCLAEKGHQVTCVDVDSVRVECIRRGVSPIYEAGLDELLRRNIGRTLNASTNLREAVIDAEITLIAVGTPFDGHEIDLHYISLAAAQVGAALREVPDYHVVVIKSTVTPGTTEEMVLPIVERESGKRRGADFGVGMNPEFLREGTAVHDFMFPDRIVLGALDERAYERMAALYECFSGADVVRTTTRTAEMIKYAANSLLATLISFSNEIGNLCASESGVDAKEVMRGVHLDKRLAPILDNGKRIRPGILSFLEAGCGFGGSCLPKDVRALIAHGRNLGMRMQLLEAVIRINEQQAEQILKLLQKHFPRLRGVRVAVLGLAFKPGTDDVRESPSIVVLERLLSEGAIVAAHDPAANEKVAELFPNRGVELLDSVEGAIADAEAVVLMTGWDEFKRIPDLLQRRHATPVLVDGRRLLDRHSVASYEGIGLGV